MPLEFWVVKSKHFAGGLLFYAFFQEEGRKWNCPFPPLQISHISPCFSFCWLVPLKKVKFGHSLPLPNLNPSATTSAQPAGTGEGSDLTEPGTQAPGLEMLSCTSSPNSSSLCPTSVPGQKTLSFYLSASSCLSILPICLLLLKMFSYKMFYTVKQPLPTKRGHSLPEYIFDVFSIH